jgi:mRNA deadenylase 3'-5' endonuclease subunit Ccr4
MNSAPNESTVFQYLFKEEFKAGKRVKKTKMHLYDLVKKYLPDENPLQGNLVSTYQYYSNGKDFPPYTCYMKDCKKVIDHIFFHKAHFTVNSLLELPQEEYLLPYLPTKHFPSDHLKIEAVLSFK